jgi:hypothetical protein
MKIYVGIWVDRRKAIVAILNQPDLVDETERQTKISEIASGVEKRVRTAGGSRTGNSPWGPQQVVSESKAEARHQAQLKEFYQRLVKVVSAAHRILIMGPGKAKNGLMKMIETDPKLAARVAGVESSDKLTPKQLAARVGDFFQL